MDGAGFRKGPASRASGGNGIVRRVICYVDGFNLYHAICDKCETRPDLAYLKWLDLAGLARSLLKPYDQLEAVRYFSAYAEWLPKKWARHKEYVTALRATAVDVNIARFKDKLMRCPQGHTWTAHEEKETDVHFALSVLEDAFDDKFDAAVLVTADSDYVPVIKKVRARWPKKKIVVAAPPGRLGRARDLADQANGRFEITLGKLRANLLPATVLAPDGTVIVTRPTSYQPPAEPAA